MIYFTGDIHGSPYKLQKFCKKKNLTKEDIIVILGDVGANYYENIKDDFVKQQLNDLGVTVFCIHGNHEQRPERLPTYKEKLWNSGTVYYEEEFPKLLFAKDGEIFTLNGLKYLVIGGAYSVDKDYRIMRGFKWFSNEQPNDKTKKRVEEQLRENRVDVILSHTCPHKYEPHEMFLPGLDQSKIDKSTELWLDTIEDKFGYSAWLCGHWHTDKHIDKIHFLYNSFMSEPDLCSDMS